MKCNCGEDRNIPAFAISAKECPLEQEGFLQASKNLAVQDWMR
jgi:hypothetical protein